MATRFQLARGSSVLGAIARGPTGATGATGATGTVDFDDVSTATIVSADLVLFGDVSDSNDPKKATLQSAVDTSILANGATFPNTGLHILDTNASHDLIIAPGSNLAADRTLTITTGDADRTLDISAASVTVSAYMAGILDDADEATFKASVNLEPGTDVQAYSARLTDIAALTATDSNIIVGNGSTWVAENGSTALTSLGLTANGQSLVTAANYAAMRTLLDLEAGTDFYSIAGADAAFQPLDSDLTAIAALTTTAAGRSALTITDPNADRILAWDDSAGAVAPIALADITDEGAPASGDFLLIYGAEGDLRRVDWADLPGAAGGISDVVEDTTPQLGGMLDVNGQAIGDGTRELLTFVEDGSAVNHVEIENQATGGGPIIRAAGDDTHVDLILAGKGDGVPKIGSNAIIDAGDTASEGAAGIVELATDAETQTGTDTARAITPANLTAAAIKQGKHTIYIPAAAMITATTSGAASASLESSTNDVNYKVFDFDASADEHVHFNIAMPKNWDEGTITFQVFWTTTATDTDGVAWGLQGVAIGDGDAIDASWGTAVVVTDAVQSTAGEVLATSESAAVTIAGSPAVGDVTFFRLFRDVSDAADTMAEDARLIGVKIFYTSNAATDV